MKETPRFSTPTCVCLFTYLSLLLVQGMSQDELFLNDEKNQSGLDMTAPKQVTTHVRSPEV